MVVGCWFSVHNARANSNTVEYWYQLLDKAAPPAPGAVPNALPLARPRPGLY